MLGRHDYLSDLEDAPKTKMLSTFINEKTKQIDTQSLVKFAQTSKANLIMVGEVLGRFLLTDFASHPDPVMQARENIILFCRNLAYRKPEWLPSDRFGKNHVFKQVFADKFNDPVSKILRGEITAEQQTILNGIAEILANPASVFIGIQREVLESRYIQAYIASGQLTIEQVYSTRWDLRLAFNNAYIRAYLASSQLTIGQVLSISSIDALAVLSNDYVCGYITRGQLTIEQVLGSEFIRLGNIEDEHVRRYIASRQLTVGQALSMNEDALIAFQNAHIRPYIDIGQLTIEQVLNISTCALICFKDSRIRGYIASGQFTVEQVLAAEWDMVRPFYKTDVLTPAQVIMGRMAINYDGLSTPPLSYASSERVRLGVARGPAPAEEVSNGGSGAADYYSLSTPLLGAISSRSVRLEVARDPEESKCCESSCSIQ